MGFFVVAERGLVRLTQLIVFVVEKMAASIHDTEEATATAFKIILDEKVCHTLFPRFFLVHENS